MKLSDRKLTTKIKNGFFHVIVPDNTKPSGYASYKLGADTSFINRGVLHGNDCYASQPFHVYHTDNSTENLPAGVDKVGVLEAFGIDSLQLRYTCFTNNKIQVFGNKRVGNTWTGWHSIGIDMSDIDHNKIENTHNLTTDIDHNQLTNFKENEHIDWTNASDDFKTSGIANASNFVLNSDVRLKENITECKTNTMNIQIKEFNFINDKGKRRRYGVIAQNIENDYPEFVYTDKNGNKTVAYIDLLLVKVANLEHQVRILKEKNNGK